MLSSNALPVETPPAQKKFSQLTSFSQQIRISGPQLGRAVQAAYNNMTTSLSRTASGRGRDTGKFNFGVVTEGGGEQAGGTTGWGSSTFVVLDGK